MISLPCFLLRYKFGWAFGIRPRKSCAKIKVHFDDSTCIKTIFHMVTECEYGTYCEASRTIGRSLPRVRCFEELIILTFHRSEICTLIYFPCLTISILLLRPLSIHSMHLPLQSRLKAFCGSFFDTVLFF